MRSLRRSGRIGRRRSRVVCQCEVSQRSAFDTGLGRPERIYESLLGTDQRGSVGDRLRDGIIDL
jgi:hypothetical protein